MSVRVGSRGGEVRRLQRALVASGATIDPRERVGELFGPSTLAALHDLQRKHGLTLTSELDEPTVAVLYDLKQSITINIQGTATSAASTAERGRVSGQLVDGDGAPLANR